MRKRQSKPPRLCRELRNAGFGVLPLAFVLCFAFFSLNAWADTAAQARHHDEKARSYFERGQYESAVQEFFIVQRTAPTTSTLYNIALCFQHLERVDDEFNYLSEYLVGEDTNEERRSFAENRMKKLAPSVARVVVDSNPRGASVFIDREELGAFGTTPAVIAIPKGRHRVIVRRPGYHPREAELVAVAGEEVKVEFEMEVVVGEVRISAPLGAEVSLRSVKGVLVASGSAPLQASVPPGDYRLVVIAPGYKKYRGIVSVVASGVLESVPELEALPPPSGEITLTSNVAGALVTLDGEPTGFAPLSLPSVDVGRHRIEMSKTGRMPWSGEVSIAEDQHVWLTSTLEEPVYKTIPNWAIWTAGGLGSAALINASVFGILTAVTHTRFENTQDPALADRGSAYATVADISLISGVVLAATALVFFAINGPQVQRDSTATFSGGQK